MHDCDCKRDFCDSVKGNAFDLELKKNDCEVRADITVSRERSVRLWGIIKDCEGKPVKDAQVKLVKVCFKGGKIEFEGVAHTISDCLGFYQFDICPKDENDKYRVIVGKASYGNERTIEDKDGICNPCKDKDWCEK